MARVLFWLVLGFVIWWWWRTRQRAAAKPPPSAAAASPKALPQAMLRCAQCGLHLPRGEALLTQDGHAYCGAEHRALGPAARR